MKKILNYDTILENKFRLDKINLINYYLEFNCNNITKITILLNLIFYLL